MKKKIRRIYFIVFHSHEAKTNLEISHLKCFLPTKAFSLQFHSRKDSSNFQKFYMKLLKKKIPSKISERFFRRNVQFSPFHTWNKIFWMFLWSVSHRHTKKIINSPQIVSLSHEERKNIYIFVVILNYFPGKKRVFFHSVSHSRKLNSPENVFILDFTNRGIKFSHTWKKKNPLKILLIVFFYSVSHIKKFPWKQFKVEKTSKSEIIENYTQD